VAHATAAFGLSLLLNLLTVIGFQLAITTTSYSFRETGSVAANSLRGLCLDSQFQFHLQLQCITYLIAYRLIAFG